VGRIRGIHLGGRHEFSTFRLSLGSILASARVEADIVEDELTAWMHQHLGGVLAIPFEDADTLGELERRTPSTRPAVKPRQGGEEPAACTAERTSSSVQPKEAIRLTGAPEGMNSTAHNAFSSSATSADPSCPPVVAVADDYDYGPLSSTLKNGQCPSDLAQVLGTLADPCRSRSSPRAPTLGDSPGTAKAETGMKALDDSDDRSCKSRSFRRSNDYRSPGGQGVAGSNPVSPTGEMGC
jgi:hypothetical protein